MTTDPHYLYVISPPVIDDVTAFSASLQSAFDAGDGCIGAFQLRLKTEGSASGNALTDQHAASDTIHHISDIVRPICQAHDIPFIMNDSPALAHACGADGVHLGQEDGLISNARDILGDDAIIGVSCHASRHLAMQAGDDGADYVAFGAFYDTPSKSAEALAHWGRPTPDILGWWSTETVLPCVAIGGITIENAPQLLAAGADFIAVLSSIWRHPQGGAEAVNAFRRILADAP